MTRNKAHIVAFIALITSCLAATIQAEPVPSRHSHADIGVINQDSIALWLTRHGKLSKDADDKSKAAAIARFLGSKSFKQQPLPGRLGKQVMQTMRLEHWLQKSKASKTTSSLGKVSAVQALVVNNVKVLAIMIDFPDLPHDDNRLSSADTGMYYASYEQDHYQQMLFASNGYAGPAGQTLRTAYQFYQQESGASLNFTGQAYGWVTADHDAAYYGGNDPDNNDDDKAVPELVTEAVTKAVAQYHIDLSEFDQTDYFDIDGDGNLNEPDGIIDHVMIFHSSIGEEAGGGVLGQDAVWSHRSFVHDDNGQPVPIPGSNISLYGYTITPIDAAIGVVVHEFGHDLGVPDEYDTNSGAVESPVAGWSLMASGSWLGSPAGTSPASFSPYARDYYQSRYGGNWLDQREINFDDLNSLTLDLVAATDHDSALNQVKVNLPPKPETFDAPYAGQYQFYSQSGNELNHSISFDLALPADASTLTMKARWDIEEDYDYVQIKVNGTAIAGNLTRSTNPYYGNLSHYISGKSTNVSGAEGALGWVDLSFDLASYAGQNVTLSISYVTDQYAGGYGFVFDQLSIDTSSSTVFSHGGESSSGFSSDGFIRVQDSVPGAGHNYYIQLRAHQLNDAGLQHGGYQPGVLVWYRNQGQNDNNVNEHPGQVFIGVVDADQHALKSGSMVLDTSSQLKDAAFSLYEQMPRSNDDYLTANPEFNDLDDYSMPEQPASGIILPALGFNMTIKTQATDSSTAQLQLANISGKRIRVERTGLTATLTALADDADNSTEYHWDFGDGSTGTGHTVNHTFAAAGSYQVKVSYTSSSGSKTLAQTVTMASAVAGNIQADSNGLTVNFNANVSGGQGELSYLWDFGDGSSSTLQAPAHSYGNAGSYQVLLTVTDELNASYAFTTTLNLVDAPVANFSYSANNLAISFNGSATGGDGSYSFSWDFGDGTSSSEQNPDHNYANAGSYTVILTVSDGQGASASHTVTVRVSAPATAKPSSSGGSGGGLGFGVLAMLLLACSRKSQRL